MMASSCPADGDDKPESNSTWKHASEPSEITNEKLIALMSRQEVCFIKQIIFIMLNYKF